MDFQKYNIKEKKKRTKRKKTEANKTNNNKKENKATRIIKKTPTTTQRLYMVFALRKESFF